MIPETIQKIISSHKYDLQRISYDSTQPQIKVSRAVSFLAVLYERIRNTIDYEEEHLLRKRAIKRILLRLNAFRQGNANIHAENVTKEIIWARYLTDYPVPLYKIEIIAKIITKYQSLVHTYKKINAKKIQKSYAEQLYGICAFEIERILVPNTASDALVNAQFQFINSKRILASSNLPKKIEPIQNYIATHKASIKSDSEMIAFHLFYNKFTFWVDPSAEQMHQVAQNFDTTFIEMNNHLSYKISNNRLKEVIRQSIPFKITNKIINTNPDQVEMILTNQEKVNEQIEAICNEEYKQNKKILSTTIIKSIIYIFITKILLAFIIEIPYELAVDGHINFLSLGINIFFPVITMFIVANSFSIPSTENTELIKNMIKAILSNDTTDDEIAFKQPTKSQSPFRTIFRIINLILFFLVFAGITLILNLLEYNIPGIVIFMIFFSTIFFVAYKLRNTAAELRVVAQKPSIFSPIIDIISTPILVLGKYLSEGASQLNFLTIFFDFLIEAPFKTIIKVFEEWNSFIRETKEEIV